MRGCGDRMRTEDDVSEMFNAEYPDCQMFQSTVSRDQRIPDRRLEFYATVMNICSNEPFFAEWCRNAGQ